MINNKIVLEILIKWANAEKCKPYIILSEEYLKKDSQGRGHRSWGEPLGALNRSLHKQGAPAISALVINKKLGMPGDNFWNCAPNAKRPKNGDTTSKWKEIRDEVFGYDWSKVKLEQIKDYP